MWLCRPGLTNDPCTASLNSTDVSATGATVAQTTSPPKSSAYDCFYVYPTVSKEPADNSDLTVQSSEVGVARLQASRFSAVCNVWAPMYRQATLAGSPGVARREAHVVAYRSLLAGWHDYLAHHNDGKPIVFIGDSQGASILIQLIHDEIDASSTLRRRLVSAILLGANVQVASGQPIGGSFAHIPLCASAGQVGCVIAYSPFGSPPPIGSMFGRVEQSTLAPGQAPSSQQVACTNPADLGGGIAPLQPYFLAASAQARGVPVETPWVSYPGLYTASCLQAGGATWLQVTASTQAGDPRPRVTELLGPQAGFHYDDVQLALGNLVADVASEESAYRSPTGTETQGT